jgi:DNA-binding NtrC family response regulator
VERHRLGAAVSAPVKAAHEIVVVDDEMIICNVLRKGLNQDNFRVTALTEPQEAVAAVAERRPCLVIVDMHMPGMNGLQVLKEIKGSSPDVPVVLISGNAGAEERAEARKLGACEFLSKPIDWRYLRNIANLSLFLKQSNMNEGRMP